MNSTTTQEVNAALGARNHLQNHWPAVTELPAGDMAGFWQSAAEAGWTSLDASGFDTIISIARELGRAACPFPIADSWIAGQLLDRDEEIRSGELRAAVAPSSSLQLNKVAFLEAGEALTHVLFLPAAGGTAELRPVKSIEITPGIALPAWSEATVGEPVARVEVGPETVQRIHNRLRLVLAARAMGAAERSHEWAVEHAKQRVQFGKPIGSFQAVQHRTANCAIEIALFEQLTGAALQLQATDEPSWQLSAELAVAHAVDAAPFVQLEAHHTLAAQGYFEQHEAPWLFRRVHADISRIGLFPRAAGTVADELLETGVRLPRLELGKHAEAFRGELREMFERIIPGGGRGRLAESDPEVIQEFVDAGLVGMGWPAAFGGRGASVEEAMVMSEEVGYNRIPVGFALGGADIIGEAIIRFGTPQQQADFLPTIRRGDLRFYLGYSEPDVGSDLASLKTTAVLDGEEWVINGTKKWGTAGRAEYVWLAARTDPDATPRHAGISVFLFPTDTPGWSIENITALTGEQHAITHFDNVRVPASALIGKVNEGWKVITQALAAERVSMAGLGAGTRRLFDDLLDLLSTDRPELAGGRGSAVRAELTRLATRLQGARVLTNASARANAAGGGARLEAPMAKIVGSSATEEFGEFALKLLGPGAALSDGSDGAINRGRFEYGLRISIMNTVGGGTNDIQRNLISRALGLPKG
jgi:alkylation response protein AidB-like acyl-CoA dehydrogenase